MNQEKFFSVYRGKHTSLRFRAYLRLAKVYGAKLILHQQGIDLKGVSVFDYGFGAGAFFLACEKDCELYGLELDPQNVSAVTAMLNARGYGSVNLDTTSLDFDATHSFFNRQYHLIVLSHVLEHMEDPVSVLTRMREGLRDDGLILGLVPINEQVLDENHLWVCQKKRVFEWADRAGLFVVRYLECDPIGYLIQPLLYQKGRIGRIVAQGISLSTGLTASSFAPENWFSWSNRISKAIGGVPSQAVFLLGK